jgi:YVTN family beta-propeller protein
VDPTVHRAYVTNNGNNTVSVLDTITNANVGAPIPVGISPVGVGVDPTVHRAYVTNDGSNTVTVIDTTTNFASAPIPMGLAPVAVGIGP